MPEVAGARPRTSVLLAPVLSFEELKKNESK